MSESAATIPGLPEETEGGLTAPVIYFEGVATHGVGPGIGRVALEMLILERSGDGLPVTARKIVAQLRGPLLAFSGLRQVIEAMEAMAAPPPDQKPN